MLTVQQINEDTYLINDEFMCTSYLIIGSNAAMLIDTGMPSNNNLLETIRNYTDKEIIVFLTHGHYDHTGHLNEFSSFYMFKEDTECFIKNPQDLKKAKYLKDGQLIDLGNMQIEVYKCIGHTQGSCLFIDKKNKNIFTGDEFGSGCGVWMQVMQASPLSIYIQEIDKFLKHINDDDSYTLWSGHYGQEKTGRLGYNPLNISMVRNLKELSIKLLKGELELQETDATSFNDEKTYYVAYKNAEMDIRKSLIK